MKKIGTIDNIIWIGGSPCSGKSSITERLCLEFNLEYYKCDDYLDQYIKRGVQSQKLIMQKYNSMSMDQTWIERNIQEQTLDEIEFYEEAFEMILEDLGNLEFKGLLVVEGAACLPSNILKHKINFKNYICIVPTYEFQIEHYSKREWVRPYLSECSNDKLAFDNWMQRDAMFAKIILDTAIDLEMNYLVASKENTLEENYLKVKNILIGNGILKITER